MPIGRRDIAIATVLCVLGLLLMWLNVVEPAPEEELGLVRYRGIVPIELALPLFMLVTVPLLWRRSAPLPAVGAAFAGLLLNELLVGTDVLRCGVVLPTALLFAFSTGALLDGRDSRIGFGLASGLTFVDFGVGFDPLTTAMATGLTMAMWGVGRIVRSRARIAAELRARTVELRDARDERARLEVATDRARVSRELDELLRRRLGELARLADEGSRSVATGAATATLVDIERGSRRTLEQMRAAVGALRSDDAAAPTMPQPALTHLEALVARRTSGGARLTVEGNPRVLPPAVELAAFRIVEQLLEAHAEAPDVLVRVRFGRDALEVAVSGPAHRRAKASIERARERARLHAGTLEATVRGGRAETVATLPLLAVS